MKGRRFFQRHEPQDAEAAGGGAESSVEMLHVCAAQKGNGDIPHPSTSHATRRSSYHDEQPPSQSQSHSQSPSPSPSPRIPWHPLLISLLPLLSLTPILLLSLLAERTSQSYLRTLSCYPNGSFAISPLASWRIMDSSYFFTPNLSFGRFSFTAVKTIDVAWDLFVGRGGQLGLAAVQYRVCGEWVVWVAERWGVGWRWFVAVAFEGGEVGTVGVLGKEVMRARGPLPRCDDALEGCEDGAGGGRTARRRRKEKCRWTLRWLGVLSMLLSTVYVLSWPTLMAAMTGYITGYKPYVTNDEGNLIEWDQWKGVYAVVNDAERLGFESRVVITSSDTEWNVSLHDYIREYYNNVPTTSIPVDRPGVYEYAGMNKSSSWVGQNAAIDLPPPCLNITYYAAEAMTSHDTYTPHQLRFGYTYEKLGSKIYNSTWILANGSCQPTESYQWGFSYIFLFMMSIFNFLWSCIMVGMWFETRCSSRMYKAGRRPGLLRSVLDLSAAMREEIGPEAEVLEEDELRKRLAKSGAVLMVPKNELAVRRVSVEEEDDRGLKQRKSWKRSLTRGSTF